MARDARGGQAARQRAYELRAMTLEVDFRLTVSDCRGEIGQIRGGRVNVELAQGSAIDCQPGMRQRDVGVVDLQIAESS